MDHGFVFALLWGMVGAIMSISLFWTVVARMVGRQERERADREAEMWLQEQRLKVQEQTLKAHREREAAQRLRGRLATWRKDWTPERWGLPAAAVALLDQLIREAAEHHEVEPPPASEVSLAEHAADRPPR